MKPWNVIVWASIAATLSVGCKSTPLNSDNHVKIDMNKAEKISFDNLIADISCTRLQNEEVPHFDFCKKMIRHKNLYYMLVSNFTGDEIFIYQDSGEFVNQIVFDGECIFLSSLLISPDEKELWVICGPNFLKKYELNGKHKETVTFPFSCVDMIPLHDSHDVLMYDGDFNREWKHSFALTDFSSPPTKFYVGKKHNLSQHIPQSIFAANAANKKIFILPRLNDTIYLYNSEKEAMKPYFHLEFHGDFLTGEMTPKNGWSDKEMNDIITRKKYIHAVNSFYQTHDKLFFKLIGKNNDFCTINLKNHKPSMFDSLFDGYKPDSYFVGADLNTLYIVAREKSLIHHYESIECSYPDLQKQLSYSTKHGDSWLLLGIKIKQQI